MLLRCESCATQVGWERFGIMNSMVQHSLAPGHVGTVRVRFSYEINMGVEIHHSSIPAGTPVSDAIELALQGGEVWLGRYIVLAGELVLDSFALRLVEATVTGLYRTGRRAHVSLGGTA